MTIPPGTRVRNRYHGLGTLERNVHDENGLVWAHYVRFDGDVASTFVSTCRPAHEAVRCRGGV